MISLMSPFKLSSKRLISVTLFAGVFLRCSAACIVSLSSRFFAADPCRH